MSDPQKLLREHYERQSLSPERVAAILAQGRKLAAQRQRRLTWWRWGGVAAAVTLTTGGVWLAGWTDRAEPSRAATERVQGPISTTAPVDLATLQDGIIEFFQTPDYQLDRIALDKSDLITWMQSQGAPMEMGVPASIDLLDNLGCRILEVEGVKVYILCFYLDGVPRDEQGEPMPGKRLMAVNNPDAPADAAVMMKPLGLIHLVTVPREQFVGAPQVGDPVALTRHGEWGFAAWAGRDVVYVAASPVDEVRFRELAMQLKG